MYAIIASATAIHIIQRDTDKKPIKWNSKKIF